MDEFDNSIRLTDENGKESLFDFLDLIDYKDNEYVVLTPIDEYGPITEDESAGIVILRVEPSNSEDTETYVSVEDQDELNAVYNIFREELNQDLHFGD